MKNYAIYRFAKLKTFQEIGGSLAHNYRTRPTPNADSDLTPLNEHTHETSQDVKNAIQQRLPEKYRKNAVLCLEQLFTASPAWDGWGTEKEDEYFKIATDWLKETYGKENVIATTIHRDETTPHLVAYVVPLDEETGNLNAKKWTGGKAAISKMQTDFAQKVKHLGLERGVENSQAEHINLQTYHASVDRTLKQLNEINLDKIPEPEPAWKFETKQEYVKKVLDVVIPNYEAAVIKANQVDANKRELYRLRKKAEVAEPYLNAVNDLPLEYKNLLDQEVKVVSDRLRKEYERQQEQEKKQFDSLKDTYYEFESYVNDCIVEKNNKHVELDNRLSKTEKWLKKSKTNESEYESDKSNNALIEQDEPEFYIQQYQYEYFYQRAIKDHKDKIVKEVEEKNIESVVLKLKEQSDDAKLLKDIQTFDEYVMPIVTEFKLESKAEAEKRIAEQSENERRSSQRAENERIQREALEKYQNEKKLESGRYRAVPSNSNNDVDKKVDRDNDLSM